MSTADVYVISSDPALLDPVAIHAYLTRSYWAAGIPLEVVERSLPSSLCFGLYTAGEQVGLVRVVTDHATFAYLCDVYVLEPHRGLGLSKRLMATVMAHPSLQGLRRWMLATRDAHGLYAGFGFTGPADATRYMEKVARPYGDRLR